MKIITMKKSGRVSKYSLKEEYANAISHFIGFLLSIAGLIYMVNKSLKQSDGLAVFSVIVFGISMVILYLSSTLTHFLKQGNIKDIFFSVDKIAIYLLIAGTYTPISLLAIKGTLGWTIFVIEWVGAALGILSVIRNPVIFEKGVKTFAVLSYAIMGWLIIIAIVPLINNLPVPGWILIYLGGLIYTLGIFFYMFGKFKYHHLVWHLLVLLGTAVHFAAVSMFVIS